RSSFTSSQWRSIAPASRGTFRCWRTMKRICRAKLASSGHLLSLPKEPAALANIIEVAVVDFLIRAIQSVPTATIQRGTERGYPDIEISGAAFGGGHHAVDIK